MIVLLISECEKKAFKRSRRILSRFASQIGRRTWMARMSKEGLNDLHIMLSKNASRHNAVACHRVTSRHQTELQWIVGTKRHFSNTGEFAFSHTKHDLLWSLKEHSIPQRLLLLTVQLAGLLHDLGKHISSFQTKIRGQQDNVSDPIRHERLSLAMFFYLLAQLNYVKKSSSQLETYVDLLSFSGDHEWLALLDDSQQIIQVLSQLYENGFDEIFCSEFMPFHPNNSLFPSLDYVPPLLKSIAYLVVSHHKQPAGTEDYSLTQSRYINDANVNRKALSFNLQLTPAWLQSPKWSNSLQKTAKRLRFIIDEHGELNSDSIRSWQAYTHAIARPALVFADQSISSRENVKPTTLDPNTLCFANSGKNYLDKRYMAGDLSTHLFNVGQMSSRVLARLFALQQNIHSRCIDEIPSQLVSDLPESSQYHWQSVADYLIREKDNIHEGGFFGIVMAETGSGKTRANARIMSALSGHQRLRFSVLLGMRSLTFQSGDEYLDQLGFSRGQDADCFVGSALSNFLYQNQSSKQSPSEDNPLESFGMENAHVDESLLTGLVGNAIDDMDNPWPEELKLPSRPKVDRLLQIPILISTVDHIMPAIQHFKSSPSFFFTRLASSDLIIDEIDSYNTDDLIPLAKLAYYCGLFGRKLILSSATVPPAVARSFFNAYHHGYQNYLQFTGHSHQLQVGWFTNISSCIQIKEVTSLNQFSELHLKFSHRFADAILSQPARRSADIIDISDLIGTANLDYLYARTLEGCFSLHSAHALTDPTTNIKLFVGVVRWSNVKHTQGFARHILNLPEFQDKVVRVVCYHSKHLPLILHEIESFLNSVLKRDSASHSVLLHPIIRELLSEAKANNKRDVVVVVASSPIEEVGKDHDFDWAVVEPNSCWSLAQIVGRVWRHRRKLVCQSANVLLLSTSARTIESKKVGKRFFHPGPESGSRQYGTAMEINPEIHSVAELFDSTWLRHIDTTATLVEPLYIANDLKNSGNMFFDDFKTLEQVTLREKLETLSKTYCLNDFITSDHDIVYSDIHAQNNPFRAGQKAPPIWLEIDDEETWYTFKDNRTIELNDVVRKESLQLEHSLLKLHRRVRLEKWSNLLELHGLNSCSTVFSFEPEIYGNTELCSMRFRYSDELGWETF